MKAIIDNYTKEELEIIVNNSQNMSDLSTQLVYMAHGGSNHNTIQKRLDEYGNSLHSFFFKIYLYLLLITENSFINLLLRWDYFSNIF